MQHLRQAARLRKLEGVADDSVHAFVGVELLLNRNLVVGAGLEATANADVQTFGVLAKHDEVDVFGAATLQRTQPLVEQLDRPIFTNRSSSKRVPSRMSRRVTVVRHARIAERADENRVELPQRVVAVRRNRDAGLEIVVSAPRQMLEIEAAAEALADGVENFHRFGGDFFADSIAGDDCDIQSRDISQRLVCIY